MPKGEGQGWRSIKVRRLREDVQPFVDLLVSEMPADVEYHLLGSWRRGAKVIGDIDVLLVTENGELNGSLFESGVALPPSVDWQRQGPKVAQGDLWIGEEAIHIDFWSCKPNERGAYLCFATGPVELNMVQRQRAIRMGYALSQIGLLDRETKRQLDNGTEKDIYRWLGLDYLTPEQREKWTKPKQATPKPYPQQQKPRRTEMPTAAQRSAAKADAARLAAAKEQAGSEATDAVPTETTDDSPNNVTPINAVPVKAAPPAAATPPKKAPRNLEFGGVKINLDDAKEALEALKKAKSMFVRQPLAAIGNPLATSDYHGVAGKVFTADPTAKKKPQATKTAFVGELAIFILDHEK
ncbi:MAG: polymerase [Actinoplanes sp.]|jgi:hypothetical protein|nr:polymerase [Actinoplanes sp.]